MKFRNFYDPNVKSRNLWTSIPGAIGAILSILVLFGVLTPEQSGQLQTHAANLYQYGSAIVGIVLSIIAMFAKSDA
jgi:hypothetical protein